MSFARPLVTAVLCATLVASCTSVTTVRLQPNAVEVGPGLRPVAAIQANAISGYILFIPIPGVNLDKAINQLLVVAAKTIGADKVELLSFDATPDSGVWALRKLLWYRSARATGIAVQVTAPSDPNADQGPEPPGATGVASPPGGTPPPAASPGAPAAPASRAATTHRRRAHPRRAGEE